MSDHINQPDREFLAELQRSGPQRVRELCERLGVTATAVRYRLDRLQSAGLIARETVSEGRGRPHHTYRVTPAGRRMLGNDYPELARMLWRQVAGLQDATSRRQLLDGLRMAMVERYRSPQPAESVPGRFAQLQEVLNREGFDVETDERTDDEQLLPVLREHRCPYHELAAEDTSICDFEQSVFEEVLGTPVTLTQRCDDGHQCCEFRPASQV